MRRMILATIALLPVLAHAQTAAPAASQTAATSKTSQAQTTQVAYAHPAAFLRTAETSGSAPEAPSPIARAAVRTPFHDVIKTSLNQDLDSFAISQSGEVAFNLGTDADASAPKLIHTVNRQLPADAVNAKTGDVAIRMIVDPYGVPSDFTIVHSAGAAVDQMTLAAVKQYRFQPATLDHVPVPADVTVKIALTK